MMIEYIQLNGISKYRLELMGLSALLILLCHSVAYIDMPNGLKYVLSFGNIGVDLFLFLSGMGLWYSLENPNRGGVNFWYRNRYMKLFIPYLITVIPFELVKILIGEPLADSIWDWLFGLSTLRFYVTHKAPWFIAALIPLYFLAPLFHLLVKKYTWKATVSLIAAFYLLLLIPTDSNLKLLNDVINNVQFVAIRATCFVLGMGLGQSVKGGRQLSIGWLVGLAVTGMLAVGVTRHLVYGYFFFTLPVLSVFCSMIRCANKWFRSSASFLGQISLESYLLNTMLPSVIIPFFSFISISNNNNLFLYLSACILGLILGYILHVISKKLLENIIIVKL